MSDKKRAGVKVYATQPGVNFPVINNNSPFERQKKIVEQLQSDGYTVDSLNQQQIVSWEFLAQLGLHDPDYLRFLAEAYDSFEADSHHKDFCRVVPAADTRTSECQYLLVPCNINRHRKLINDQRRYKEIGNYANDNLTPIFKGLKYSVLTAVSDAIFAALAVADAFSAALAAEEATLTTQHSQRVLAAVPCHPGHHSGYGFAGYCYLNNSMAAYLTLRMLGYRVALLDLDFHAGDGSDYIARHCSASQALGAPLPHVRSIHIDPKLDYPFYVSDDFDNRLAFNGGCSLEHYLSLVKTALTDFNEADVEVLVVAFGSDTYCHDPEVVPQYRTNIDIDDYLTIGSTIKDNFLSTDKVGRKRKVVVIQEGGYSDQCHLIFNNFLSALI